MIRSREGLNASFEITPAVRIVARQLRGKNCLATSRCLFWALFLALLRSFALFCGLAFALFCAYLALICVFLHLTAFRTTAFGICRDPDGLVQNLNRWVFGEGVKSARGETAILGRGNHTRNMFGTSLHASYPKDPAVLKDYDVLILYRRINSLSVEIWCAFSPGKQVVSETLPYYFTTVVFFPPP